MTHNNTSYTLSLGNYLCTISKINFHLHHSQRYLVTGTRFFGEGLDHIAKTCTELSELITFLKKIKYITH